MIRAGRAADVWIVVVCKDRETCGPDHVRKCFSVHDSGRKLAIKLKRLSYLGEALCVCGQGQLFYAHKPTEASLVKRCHMDIKQYVAALVIIR